MHVTHLSRSVSELRKIEKEREREREEGRGRKVGEGGWVGMLIYV
jgi:hypothetical protein